MFCFDDILNKNTFEYDAMTSGIVDGWIPAIPKANRHCRLRQYLPEDVVNCLDSSNFQHHDKLNSRGLFRFVFMGDSRMRQQFYNFLKVFILKHYFINHFKIITILLQPVNSRLWSWSTIIKRYTIATACRSNWFAYRQKCSESST